MTDGQERASDASETFALVAIERRFAVVRALWDLTSHPNESVSFAALREQAGVRDSGQFNYHLGKLAPEFVRGDGDGYHLTEAGRRVVGTAVSGVYTDLDASVEPRSAGDCRVCEGTLELTYDEGVMMVRCRDCERRVFDMSTPPVLVAETDPEDLSTVLWRHAMAEVQRMNSGFCPYCGGPLDTAVELPEASDALNDVDIKYGCAACERTFQWNVYLAILDHPAVVDLFHDAGIDVREFPLWKTFLRPDLDGRIVERNSVRVEVTIELDGRAVTLTVDDSLDVVAHRTAPVESTD
ncbi:hypothetical protein BRD06_05185 [Halobacteriales archaeon QS_9_67_15]|nr:MAG: hypothetical protein BRD06_05185 [Halobacteriales archaeon QS_9_67_15]